jgi:hypothetical protein
MGLLSAHAQIDFDPSLLMCCYAAQLLDLRVLLHLFCYTCSQSVPWISRLVVEAGVRHLHAAVWAWLALASVGLNTLHMFVGHARCLHWLMVSLASC